MSAAVGDGLSTLLGDLRESEINVEITLLNDDEWSARLGDPLNGYRAERMFGALSEAGEWLRAKAIELYPDSGFARAYRHGFG
jgi:hypothetical protein